MMKIVILILELMMDIGQIQIVVIGVVAMDVHLKMTTAYTKVVLGEVHVNAEMYWEKIVNMHTHTVNVVKCIISNNFERKQLRSKDNRRIE